MTKITKWWQNISFWMKLKAILVSLGIGSEITLYIEDSHSKWKLFAAVMTALGIIITQIFQDNNNNGKVDIFEDK